jgi:DNA repair photolyase
MADDAKSVNLRWRLAEDDPAPDALFPDESLPERHVGTGDYRGMEFLHVNAKRLINEVPAASQMPFRFTINAYRGCSHACSYCISGDTPILMADGRTTPVADVRVQDMVYGTVRQGAHRRYVATEVLDHWSTCKPAYRVTLEDGTELVTSGDHRFLTERGWKHVTGSEHGRDRRPHLTLNNKLVGTGNARLKVVSIESLGRELPLFDITTGTGDFIANGVISHNCFARPTHEYLGLNTGEDFDRRIVVKVNAVERARAELLSSKWHGDHIAMGTNTDPYQKAEGKYHLTRGVIGVLGEVANPFSILTKSTLVLRDLDLLVAAAKRTSVRLNFSIGTLDREVWRLTEPGTPPPEKRVDAVRRLNEAGIPCGVLVAPVLPGLSDGTEQLKEVVDACVGAGAVSLSAISLHLRPGVREHYLGWLASARPDLMALYQERFTGPGGPRSYQPKAVQHELAERVRRLVRAAESRSQRRLERVPFVEAADPTRPAPEAQQLGLGV